MLLYEPGGVCMAEPRAVLYHVQVARLIAASGILLSHAVTMFAAPSELFWFVPWTRCVDIFFVISGFVMAHLTQGSFGVQGAPRAFLIRRAVRIVPPYWFFTLLLVAIYPIVSWQMRDTSIDPAWLGASLLFLPWPRAGGKFNPVLAQGWTLNFEAFFYVAFGLALLSRRGLWLLCLFLVVLAVGNTVVPDNWLLLKWWSNPIILFFVGGIALARVRQSGVRLNRFGMLGCIAGAAISYFVFRPHGAEIAVGMIAAAFVLADQPARLGPMRRALQYGGDASYTLYLSHTLVVGLIVAVWGHRTPTHQWVGVGVAVIASMAFALGFHRWLEAPIVRVLHRRFA